MNRLDKILERKPERALVVRKEDGLVKSLLEEFRPEYTETADNLVRVLCIGKGEDIGHSLSYLTIGKELTETCNFDLVCERVVGMEKDGLQSLDKFIKDGGVVCAFDHSSETNGEFGNENGDINYGAWVSNGKVTIDGFGSTVIGAMSSAMDKYNYLSGNEIEQTK